MAHIHLISSNGQAAQSGTRATPGQNLSADDGDSTVNSFEALLAAGADALRADEAAIQQSGENEAGDALDATEAEAADTAELLQLTEADAGQQSLKETPTDPAQLTTDQMQELADGGTQKAATPATVPLSVDAPRQIGVEDDADPDAPELRLPAQKSAPDRTLGAVKAGPEQAAATQQPVQLSTKGEAQLQQQPNAPLASSAPTLQATPSAVQTSSAAPTATTVSIDVPEQLGTNAWSNSFSQRIVLAVGRNDQIAEIRVNPPHLGPVEVSLSLSGDDNRIATVHFSAHHAGVREAIESAIPRLREMFNEAGISLGNATVGSESSGRETGDSERGNAATDQAASGDANDQAAPSSTMVSTTIAGKVDTFA